MEQEFTVVRQEDIEDKYMTDAEAALKNGGWNYRKFEKITDQEKGGEDRERNVTVFRLEVPEFGTYEVTVTIKAGEGERKLILFAGRRNLIDTDIILKSGETYRKTFYQAVTPYIPALSSRRCNDKFVFVSIAGVNSNELGKQGSPEISLNVTRKDVPVIWIAGDSTLTDQNAGIPYYPYGSCAGWAQILSRYVDKAAVCNLAHSGMTTNCFRDDGHYAISLEFMKEGDFFIIQFGHNDQKRRNLGARGGYAQNLRRFANEVRLRGVTPIICSPISRIPLKLSETEAKELSMPLQYSLLQEYADAARDVATEQEILFADLHEETMKKWIELSDNAKDYFIKGDITHTNEYGAFMIADMFVRQMGEALPLIKDSLLPVPEPCQDTKEIPKELPLKSPFDIEPPYLDISGIPEYEGIRKAFKYGLLDPCVMYLHPYDAMPKGQLLMVMFNAFRMSGVRPYKKKFADIKVDEWISGYVQALIEEGYIDDKETKSAMFGPDDPLTYGKLAEYIIKRYEKIGRCADKNERQQRSGEEYVEEAKALGIIKKANVKAEEIANRADVYTILADYMDVTKEKSSVKNDSHPEDADVHPVH
ncbi:GDSL-type esterase/lipase family protein [Butyrivibrio sp. XBB1001]|uniref:GDSL-type esterase/lipase family protein n=1 Tax=Butyrivibrio sp. XBB1001 TaxID=1280682 RepID=UPI0003FFF7EF|nr:GDSL-type esterase/lipase family protein [Butyrivibrio sp. XBB1001]